MASTGNNAAKVASNKRTHSQTFKGDMEELNSAPCPNDEDGEVCGQLLTRKMKFCPQCGWTVNRSIFQRPVLPPVCDAYICDGLDEDDQVCGKEVLPTMKFCPHCGKKRTKILKPGSNESVDVTGVQVSKSVDDFGNSKAEENEQAAASNIPANSSNNNNEKIGNPEVGNLSAGNGSQPADEVQEDLISGSQSSTDVAMASSSGSSQESHSPRDVAMEVTEAGGEDDSSSRADGNSSAADENLNVASRDGSAEDRPSTEHRSKIFKTETKLLISDSGSARQTETSNDDPATNASGDVTGVKGQALGRTRSVEESTGLENTGPERATGSSSGQSTKPRNSPASEPEKKPNDKKENASYAGAVRDRPTTQSQSNTGGKQGTTLKDVAQQSDKNRSSDSQQGGSNTTTTATTDDGKLKPPVRVLLPKDQRIENNEFAGQGRKPKSFAKGPTYPARVLVHFHVVVSKEEFSSYKRSKGDKVVMIFGNQELGGWRDAHRVMKEEKVIDAKNFLMVLDVEIEKYLITTGRAEYKYAILHGGDGKQSLEFEFVPKKSNANVVNRELRIPSNQMSQCTEWHQYDGIMSREPEGGIKSFFTDALGKVTGKYYDQLLNRTREAVTAMLPSWDEIQGTDTQCAKNLLEKLDQVCFCAKNNFLNDKLTPDETKMKDFLEEFIQPVIQRLNSQIGKELKESETGVQLALACCLVYIIQKYGLQFNNVATKSIFHALLLKPDRETKMCHDYQQLVDVHFPTFAWRRNIAQALLYFMSRMATKDFIEPMWILAVPLLHFLDDYIKPGGAPRTDQNHRSEKWWGISNFKVLVDSFKALNAKTMPLRDYVELLSPLFEQDRLLPRTLMSVMSLEHIPYLYETKLIPMEVCLANLFYFVNTVHDPKKTMPALTMMENVTKTRLSEFDPTSKLEEKLDELCLQRKLAYEVLERVCENTKWLEFSPYIVTAVKINANVISAMQRLLGSANIADEMREMKLKNLILTVKSSTDDLVSKVFSWVSRSSSINLAVVAYNATYSYPRIDYDEVQTYGYLCQVEFHDDDTTAHFKATLDKHMTKRLKGLPPNLQILVFGDVDFSKYPPEVEACFSKAAFDVLENVENTRYGDYGYMFDQLDKGGAASKLQELLSRIFEKSWPKDKDNKPSNDEATILHHILTWPSFKRFLRLFLVGLTTQSNVKSDLHVLYTRDSTATLELFFIAGVGLGATLNGRSRKTGLLSGDCVDWIQIGMSVFDAVIAKLLSGAMTVVQLKQLLDEKMKKQFLDLFVIVEKTSESGMKNVPESGIPDIDKCEVLMKVLVWRQTELHSFEDYCLKVNHLLGLCANLRSAELDELKQLSAVNPYRLMIQDFCKPRLYSAELAQQPKYEPKIVYFSIPREGELMLDHLSEMRTSIVFNDTWHWRLRKLMEKQNTCTFAHIVEMWKFCKQYWEKFSEEIKTGQLTFGRVDAIFGSFDRKYDLIEKELALIIPKDLAAERRRQIEQYHQLDQYSRGASIMLKLKEEFELKGDFATAEILVDMVKDKNKALREITKQLVDSGKQLEEITDERVECLDIFRKHKKFADWLRVSVKGPKEVKVLVDLAMISAEGQGDMEVEKVLCLNAAATGYAPLIYDLTPEMGFRDFLPLCQAVWRMLDVDPALPRKFRDTALQLDWLNRVKESHGSVELNALANAQAINAKGIYSVGNIGNNRKTLDGVVELKLRLEKGDRDIDSTGFVNEEAERGKWQSLNLQQLNDLQSKLMLVAGKAQEGKKEVDNFVEILDGVTRLGSLYIRICNAGCSLFHHWKAIFYCDPSKPMFARVEFGKEGKHIFCGWKKDATNGVSGYIFDLCTFMEDCLREWLEHIAKQRMESYYLNYYTTEQLVILQNELPKISGGVARISKNIYPLLSLVKKDCTLENVELALVAAFQSMEDAEKKTAAAGHGDGNEDDKMAMEVDKEAEERQLQQENAKKFLRELEDSGFSHKLAVRALKKHGPENIEDAIMWCLEHNMDGDESDSEDYGMEAGSSVDKDNARQPQAPIQFSGLQLDKTMDSLTANLFKDPTLSNKLESLTKKLGELWRMYQQEMSTSLADYLSVKHLGCTLDRLAAMDDGRIDRSLPGYMTKGKPNLILCSRAEILAVVLSIYMNGNARRNALPGIDEVLMCHATTTAEDVELLWRRAEGDARNGRHGKIYCLVHAELLDYDVARKAEQTLDKHSHAAKEIQLVVVCCREQEDRSHIINALDRYRVKVPPVELQEVRAYLQEHLTVTRHTTVRAAADLDPEKCSVRVIKSHRAGVGKSLKVRRLLEERQQWKLPSRGYDGSFLVSIPLHCKVVDPSVVLRRLVEHSLEPHLVVPRIFHIDIAHEVQEGVDYLLFNLLILGSITDREGYIWSRAPTDLYLIETMPLMQREAKNPERRQQELQYVHHIFQLLPTLTCWSPTDSMNILSNAPNDVKDRYTNAVLSVHDQKMDDKEFQSAMFQRPFQYLIRFTANQELHRVPYNIPEGTYVDCIRCLLGHCGLRDPSWSELRHFVNFLNVQLRSCEESIFCSDYLAQDLPGFLKFVVSFLIQMSKDFATRSLTISEETPEVAMQLQDQDDRQADDILGDYGLKRRWETSPHPYLFFNADGNSFTFMGFIINAATGDVLEPGTNRVLAPRVLPRELYDALIRNRVDLSENFDALPRCEKILKMCRVLGIDLVHDPDNTYELTADNVKKMLAIHMRFRCDIPVIVMGETGCGKTRLIKFMCDLWKPPGSDMKNMILMKVHGGTTAGDIERKVKEAAALARLNRDIFPGLDIQTVLFFDEANTTEAIGMIKEIMCDHTIGGEKLPSTYGLKLIAACNPYRKHSDDMIQRLEHAGLGYHIQAHQTTDKLGRIPMRQLVYRVQSLPQSMLPLVWDFGQLSTEVETLYIRQMVHRYIAGVPALCGINQLEETIARILAASQEFMRLQKDECSFVSLRDVDRALQVMMWFYPREKELFDKMNQKAVDEITEAHKNRAPVDDDDDDDDDEGESEDQENDELFYAPPHDWTRALILALGVCYHACLQKRREYREFIARHFVAPCQLENGAQTIEKNINWCQDVFLDEVELGENIARNQALKENLFMMVICIELRIPLFLVGKPGSSKSLAKTIVADAMQGEAARSELFRALKSVHMVSYQCSPLSTPEGIVGTFRQCAKLQEGQDLNKFVSVVVLDEVGLAEDSDRMPLKTLHPLLEDGCEGDEMPAPHKKVGFIGISNWALDPAKMNRGILVQRGVPDERELEQSAKGICAKDRIIARQIDVLVQPMSKAYLELYESALKIREFFGLRDFYSLIKMVYGFMKRSGEFPTWPELQHAILRNFGGLDDIRPVEVFEKHLQNVNKNQPPTERDPACDSASLIRCSLTGDELDSESRYLLILTENYAALGLLQHELLKIKDAIIIFGSSFPKDQEYTQVCRNINRIKVCMETGRTVVLLNLENLYESLYDALNQYYVRFGDQRFVDLGLGTQRVKCRVHQSFRLIVVAEKQVVYEKFPIPLINRLEKHFLAMSTMLTPEQMEVADRLSKWATDFTSVLGLPPRSSKQPKPADVFVGHHPDTAASLVLQVCHSGTNTDQKTKLTMQQILDEAKDLLLRCAVPEAILRLNNTRLAGTANEIYKKYFEEQCHSNLEEFLKRILDDECPMESLFVQVTTHSRLLLPRDALRLTEVLKMKKADVMLEALHAFGTEQQFCRMLREFFTEGQGKGRRVLLLQCDSGDVHAELIACARYNIWNEFCQMSTDDSTIKRQLLHVIFIVQLPRIAGGCFVGFQGGKWMSYHIDDLHPHDERMPSLMALKGRSLGTLFAAATAAKDTTGEPMEMEEVEQMEEVVESIEDFSTLIEPDEEPMDIDTMASKAAREGIGNGFELLAQMHRKRAREGVKFVKEKLESPEAALDVDGIIRSCLHGAAAMLKDATKEEALKLRKTHRLQLLMDLLSEKHAGEKLSLMSVLRKRLTLLLKDKEETAMSTVTANGWLSNEAASFEAICRAGTFRRALWQYLETRVTPLLAGVVAYTDTNANLDTLMNDGDNHWITSMWLDMFSNADITIIKYKDLQTATQRMELTDFEVKTTGSDGKFFGARLPFSWIIKEQVDRLIYAAKQDASKDTLILVESALKTSALGRVLANAEFDDKMTEVIQRYLADFVRMVHKPHSFPPDVEYDLVISDIEYAMRCQYLQEREREQAERNFIDPSELSQFSIPRIHLTYENIRKRLTLFSELVQIWPESILKLADSNIPKNMPLDLICLLLLMELYLLPTKTELDFVDSRQKWVEKVRMTSPIVMRLLESVSDVAQEHLQYRDMCRFTWNRVGAVQLFIEHVCLGDSGDTGLSVKRCMPLWTALTDKTDFKTLKSFETVENFLRICNKNAADLYFGKLENCPGCEKPAEFPVKLQCGHILCARCLVETKELKVFKCHAADCLKPFPPDIKATVVTAKKEGQEKYTLYKQRCNAFFMDLVSCFCFTDNSPPEPEVIRKLMGYVTRRSKLAEKLGGEALAAQQRTKKMFEESFDPTPVVRSFLLQLMLQADIDSVHDYLEEYFESARALVQTDSAQVVELCVLVVQCLEDYHHRQSTQYKTDVERLHFARDLLARSTGLLRGDLLGIQLDSLEAIARVRYGLMETAKWMYELLRDTKTTMEVRRLFADARVICHQNQLRWPKVYLMRQIARRFGIDTLKSISELNKLTWVVPEEAKGDQQKIPDRFVVCGDNYIKLREMMAEIVLGKGLEEFDDALKTIGENADVVECLVLLVIYREVTATNIHADPQHRPPQEVLQRVTDFCMQSQAIRNKNLAMEMVGNTMKGCMHVRPNQTEMLSELIIHFRILLSSSKNNGLQKPFLDIITAPQNIAHLYLPTMPQDDMDEIRAAIGVPVAGETPTFYQCPNGHPYVIGNCGRPVALGKCLQCGAPVGGQNYQLQQGNAAMVANADTTRRGHVLGLPQKRAPNPERHMSPASAAILRMLLHMSMYLSSLENSQAVSPAIYPPIQPQHVSKFLLDHAQADVETIHSATGHSEEDVIVFMHILIDSMLRNEQYVAGLDDSMKLQTKPSRVHWEDVYVNTYILPALNGLNARVQDANNRMVNDKRLGNNLLLKTVFEVEVAAAPANILKIHEEPSLWRFRSHISLEHLAHALDESMTQKKENERTKKRTYPILQLFIKDEPQLRAIRLLPSIIRLHRLLLQRLNRCLDSSDATTMSIGNFLDDLKDENQRQELRDLILEEFAYAWDCVRPSLANYAFSGYTIPIEYTQEPVNADSRLGMLLPSLRGWGLCSVALIYYLQELQNNFLENYSKERKQILKARVDIYDASYAHFIAYHPVHDLQPIILANCNYSLEVGKGTTVEYDFGSMEKQITERFIRGRPRLGIGRMEFILYREDFTNAAIFAQLRTRIPQEPLPSQAEMERELKHRLTDVTDLLASLNIAVGFLVSIGGDPEMNILRFMSDTLKMKQQNIAAMLETCKLKHVEALWLLLSYLRARMQATYGQDAFENVDEKYRELVPDDLKPKLKLGFQHIQMDSFLILLYECIVFNITVKQNVNAEDYAENSDYPLRDVLSLYMEDSGSDYSIPALQDGRFPEEIKAKHCISTWLLALHPNRKH